MNGTTHAVFGAVGGVILAQHIQADERVGLAIVGVSILTALLPDIDHTGSWIGRRLPILSDLIALVGHRGLTHSLAALALVMGLAWHFTAPVWALAVGVGYGSHILSDMLTVAGVQLLWPVKWRVRLATIRTGGFVEGVFLVGLWLILAGILASQNEQVMAIVREAWIYFGL